jgi:hypothetical protein
LIYARAVHYYRLRELQLKASVSKEAAISFDSVALTYMINCVIQSFRSLSERKVRYVLSQINIGTRPRIINKGKDVP